MASEKTRSILLIALVVVLIGAAVYLVDPTFFGLLREGFENETPSGANANYVASPGMNEMPGSNQLNALNANTNAVPVESFYDSSGVSNFVGSIDASGVSAFVGDASGSEGFANLEDVTGPAAFNAAQGPAGCYPRDQLTPSELLPRDGNSTWAQQNPMGTGSLKGKNFLSAGALIGVNTVGQTLRNANLQLRSEPPNPQVSVSVFNNSTIAPDTNRRDLEIG